MVTGQRHGSAESFALRATLRFIGFHQLERAGERSAQHRGSRIRTDPNDASQMLHELDASRWNSLHPVAC